MSARPTNQLAPIVDQLAPGKYGANWYRVSQFAPLTISPHLAINSAPGKYWASLCYAFCTQCCQQWPVTYFQHINGCQRQPNFSLFTKICRKKSDGGPQDTSRAWVWVKSRSAGCGSDNG